MMFLDGDQFYCRPLSIQDADVFCKWCSSPEVVKYGRSWFMTPKSKPDVEQWLTSMAASDKDVALGICCKSSLNLIGYTGINRINHINRAGEFFVLIGETQYWGKGIGTHVTKMVTDYGFKTLGLHRIFLKVSEPDERAVNVFEKAGYVREGILRDAVFRDGTFHNKLLMSVLAAEWNKG